MDECRALNNKNPRKTKGKSPFSELANDRSFLLLSGNGDGKHSENAPEINISVGKNFGDIKHGFDIWLVHNLRGLIGPNTVGGSSVSRFLHDWLRVHIAAELFFCH